MRRRRFFWLAGGLVLLLALLVFLGPTLAVPLVRGRLEAALHRVLPGSVAVTGLAFDLGGRIGVSGCRWSDAQGQPVVSLGSVQAQVGLWDALWGRYHATIEVHGFELHVRRDARGRLSLAGLGTHEGAPQAGGEPAGGGSALPEVQLDFRMPDGKIVLHDPEGEDEVLDFTLSMEADRLDQPATFQVALASRNPGGPGGKASLKGTVTLAPGGKWNARDLRLSTRILIEALPLKVFRVLAGTAEEVRELEGTLNGRMNLELSPASPVQARGNLTLSGFRMAGALAGTTPLSLEELQLHAKADLDGQGNGDQEFTAEAGDFLSLRYEGKSVDVLGAGGGLQGTLQAQGDLAGLLAALGGIVRVRPGLTFAGTLSSRSELALDLGPHGVRGTRFQSSAGITGFSARDASGHPLDLEGFHDLTLDLEGHADLEAGTAELTRLDLQGGPVQLQGRGAVAGFREPSGTGLRVADSRLTLDADLDRLDRLLRSCLDLGDLSLGGRLTGRWNARTEEGTVKASQTLEGKGIVIRNLPSGEGKADLGPLDLDFTARADYEPGAAGGPTFPQLDLEAAGLSIRAHGQGALADARVEGEIRIDPQELEHTLRPWLADLGWEGSPLQGTFQAQLGGEGRRLRGDLAGEHLAIHLPPATTLEQHDLHLDWDLAFLSDGSPSAASLKVASDLEALSGDLSDGLDSGESQVKGKLEAAFHLKPGGDTLGLEGNLAITDFEVKGSSAEQKGVAHPRKPFVVSDPKVTWQLSLALDRAGRDLEIRRCDVASTFLDGGLTGTVRGLAAAPAAAAGSPPPSDLYLDGLKGTFHYLPDRLGAVLEPWLPGKLTGKDRQTLAFEYDGKWSEFDLLGGLRASQGKASLGLGNLALPGLDTAGTLDLDLQGDHATGQANLKANGGDLKADLDLDLREKGDKESPLMSKLKVALSGMGVRGETGSFLSAFNPAFLGGKKKPGPEKGFSALLDLDMDLSYPGRITPEQLQGGWSGLPKKPLQGQGVLTIHNPVLEGSPFLGEMLGRIGLGSTSKIQIDPLHFLVKDGRLQYSKPWKWDLDGTLTSFTGSVGLDGDLALDWNVPVTDALVRKYGFLGSIRGKSLTIPVRGSFDAPSLKWDQAVGDFAKKSVGGSLEDKIKEGLGGILGKKTDGREKEAQTLLKRADRLYDRGRTVEAKALYQQLRQDYRKTDVFRANKERIVSRMR